MDPRWRMLNDKKNPPVGTNLSRSLSQEVLTESVAVDDDTDKGTLECIEKM